MNSNNYTATIEYLPGHRSAIIELTDGLGAWSGGSRIDLPRNRDTGRTALYEEGFRAAERAAAVKGGTLDRFSEAFETKSAAAAPEPVPCGQLVTGPLVRRPGNALNVEIGTPLLRCRLRLPSHWAGAGASSLRWLASGGSPLVFGACTPGACPK